MNSTITTNLFILFLLAPCMVACWWGVVRLVNKSMGFCLKEVYHEIYQNPIAAAILRVGIMFTIAYLVNGAFSRYI